MKVRNGFVTNSSSSSFICVTVGYKLQDEILKQNGIDSKNLCEAWEENNYEDIDLKGSLVCAISEGEIYYIGIDVAGDLYDKTVRQHENELIEVLKKEYAIEATEKDVDFEYGEIYR